MYRPIGGYGPRSTRQLSLEPVVADRPILISHACNSRVRCCGFVMHEAVYSTVALVPPMSTMDVWRGIT